MKFKAANGRFGTLEELAVQNLISKNLRDGENEGFIFVLEAEPEKYVLLVTDIQNEQKYPQSTQKLTMYLDESAIIRANFDPKRPADKTSDPINPKK